MPYTKNEGADLWYTRRGESGPRALFIMGIAVPGDAWRPQVEPLSERLQAITVE